MSDTTALWDQLQQFAFLSVSEKPTKILLQSLCASHRPKHHHHHHHPHHNNDSFTASASTAGENAIPFSRGIFWKLFLGMLPLPPHQKDQDEPEEQQQRQQASPLAKKMKKKTASSSPKPKPKPKPKKNNVFATSSDDDDNDNDDADAVEKTLLTGGGGGDDSDEDSDEHNNNNNNASGSFDKCSTDSGYSSDDEYDNAGGGGNESAAPCTVQQNVLADYTQETLCSAMDAARKEYGAWLEARGGGGADNKPAAQQKTNTKKKKKPESAGPRFGDDSSSSSSSSDDDDANPLGSAPASSSAADTPSSSSAAADAAAAAAAAVHDPLLHGSDPKWQKYFARKKELELIDKDLNRLYFNDIEFFEEPATRKMTKSILEASLDLNVVPSYSQGMHEVAAMMLWVLHQDVQKVAALPPSAAPSPSKKASSDDDGDQQRHHDRHALARHVCSEKHLEHDAFFLYTRVLKGDFHLTAWYENQPPTAVNSITRIVDDIHGRRLSKVHLPLHDHLKMLDVPCVTYGLRWLRLLFIREFPLSQSMKIWDAVFAELCIARRPVWHSLVPELALSMLCYIGNDLVDSDHTHTLRRLMRYPPVEDVTAIYAHAVQRMYRLGSGGAATDAAAALAEQMKELLPPVSKAATTQQTTTAAAAEVHVDAASQGSGRASPSEPLPAAAGGGSSGGGVSSMFDTIANMVSSSLHGSAGKQEQPAATAAAPSPKPSPKGSSAQAAGNALFTLRVKQKRLGERLTSVIEKLNGKWFPEGGFATAPAPTAAAATTKPIPLRNKITTTAATSSSDDTSSSDADDAKAPSSPVIEVPGMSHHHHGTVGASAAAAAAATGDADKKPAPVGDDDYIMSIAELKKIRDELLGVAVEHM